MFDVTYSNEVVLCNLVEEGSLYPPHALPSISSIEKESLENEITNVYYYHSKKRFAQLDGLIVRALKDTGHYRPVFSLGVSQQIHKITNVKM